MSGIIIGMTGESLGEPDLRFWHSNWKIKKAMGVWQGVAMDSLQFYPGPPWPTLLRPAGGPPPKRSYGRFKGGPHTGRAVCIHLLPFWAPHAVRLCLVKNKKHKFTMMILPNDRRPTAYFKGYRWTPWPARSYHSTQSRFRGGHPQSGRPAAVFCPLGYPMRPHAICLCRLPQPDLSRGGGPQDASRL
jgi:hypothetical protein